MIHNRNLQEYEQLSMEIKKLKEIISTLPDGHLTYARNGKYYKWFQSDGKANTYIPAKDKKLAELLGYKKYLTLKLEDMKHEQRALGFYLRHHRDEPGMAATLLLTNDGIRNLITPYLAPLSEELINWSNGPYDTNPRYPEKKIHKTTSGHMVRSKSEAMIAMHLFNNRIPFRYECALTLGDSTYYPDFTLRHPKSGKQFYWEQNTFTKLQTYASYDIIPSINLITTYETRKHPLTSDKIDQIIKEYLL